LRGFERKAPTLCFCTLLLLRLSLVLDSGPFPFTGDLSFQRNFFPVLAFFSSLIWSGVLSYHFSAGPWPLLCALLSFGFAIPFFFSQGFFFFGGFFLTPFFYMRAAVSKTDMKLFHLFHWLPVTSWDSCLRRNLLQ